MTWGAGYLGLAGDDARAATELAREMRAESVRGHARQGGSRPARTSLCNAPTPHGDGRFFALPSHQRLRSIGPTPSASRFVPAPARQLQYRLRMHALFSELAAMLEQEAQVSVNHPATHPPTPRPA